MMTENLKISADHLRRLLSTASADASLVYLYLKAGNPLTAAQQELNMTPSRLNCAAATLRQLGLLEEERTAPLMPGERPRYSETDVLEAMDTDASFQSLYGEVQRLLGRGLNTEEMKILLGFVRYLGLPEDVISILVCYCKDRARQKGHLRNPSLRSIEKEAYFWAENGIDTVEEAAAFIRNRNQRNTRLYRLMNILQIRGRSLTAAEDRFAQSWLDMDMEEKLLEMAYEKTCLNTGGLNWAYMNKILLRWQEQGFHTVEEVRGGDKKGSLPSGQRQLDEDEMAAIRKMMQEA